MKLATRRNGTRDGELLVVSRDGTRCEKASAPTLQAALDDWQTHETPLVAAYDQINAGGGVPLDVRTLHSPLPRAYEWVDGSAFINHIVLVRKARGAEPPETLKTDPLVYQGGSGAFLAPTDPIPLIDAEHGLDYEAEVCVVLGDTPQGTKAENASSHIRLLMLVNDVTLRNLIPSELKKGFGFFTSKPSSAFSPFAITPEELGEHWREGRLHLPLQSKINGELSGDPDAGEQMHFSFLDLIQHISKRERSRRERFSVAVRCRAKTPLEASRASLSGECARKSNRHDDDPISFRQATASRSRCMTATGRTFSARSIRRLRSSDQSTSPLRVLEKLVQLESPHRPSPPSSGH